MYLTYWEYWLKNKGFCVQFKAVLSSESNNILTVRVLSNWGYLEKVNQSNSKKKHIEFRSFIFLNLKLTLQAIVFCPNLIVQNDPHRSWIRFVFLSYTGWIDDVLCR